MEGFGVTEETCEACKRAYPLGAMVRVTAVNAFDVVTYWFCATTANHTGCFAHVHHAMLGAAEALRASSAKGRSCS